MRHFLNKLKIGAFSGLFHLKVWFLAATLAKWLAFQDARFSEAMLYIVTLVWLQPARQSDPAGSLPASRNQPVVYG